MRKLIISELKKMLKSKFHLSLLIFVIVMMVVQIVREDYRAVNAYEPDLQFSTFDGEPLNTNRDLYVYADQIYSQYEGTVNEELWQRFMDDYNHLYTEFTKDENIDAVKMTNFYSEDWKALFERNERQKLTDKDHQLLQRLNESNADYVSVVYDELSGQEPDQYLLKTFYKDESSLNTLNLIYRGSTDLLQEEPLLSDKSPQQNPWNYPLYCLLHPQTMLIDQLNLSYSENGIPSHQQTNLQLYAEKQLSQPQTYGSMIPARLFIRHMQSNTMITIVILAILFANTFAIEKSTKMDQLIVATKAGYTRITIAKTLANLLIAAVLYLILNLIAFLFTVSTVPLHGFDLPVIPQLNWILNMFSMPYLSYRQLIISLFSLQCVAIVAITFTASLLSCLTKNRFITILILFSILFIPPLLYPFLDVPEWLSSLSIINYVNLGDLYLFFTSNARLFDPILSNGIWVKDLVWIFWLFFAVLASIGMLIHAKYHIVTTK